MESEILDRLPPHDLDAERSVIGSILLDPTRLDEVRDILRPEDFHADAHRRIFRHFLAMRNGGAGAIDATLLLDRLRQSGDIEAVGGADGGAAANIVESTPASLPTPSNAADHARIVKAHAERRRRDSHRNGHSQRRLQRRGPGSLTATAERPQWSGSTPTPGWTSSL